MLRKLLACPDHILAGPHVVDLRPLGPFGLDQPVGAVKGDAPVMTNDAAAAESIRKAGDDAGFPALHDFGRIGVEHSVIVGLAVFRERFLDLRVRLEPCCFQASFDHAQAANGKIARLNG